MIKLCFWQGKKDKKLNTTALKDVYLVAVVVILFLYWFLTVKSRETRAAKTQQQVADLVEEKIGSGSVLKTLDAVCIILGYSKGEA